MRHLVIGHGEVGTALAELLGCGWIDLDAPLPFRHAYDCLHIAFPHSPGFARAVRYYRALLEPAHVVIHSTVPVGTCETLDAIHSPVRGVHPNLLAGLRAFVKYFGGPGAPEVALEFERLGVVTHVHSDARTCEALKLWETTQYGVFIRLMQEMHRYCEDNGLDFNDVYTFANNTYNDGYDRLGLRGVQRPVLKYTGPDIGGHCVLPNAELLGGPVAALVREGFKP